MPLIRNSELIKRFTDFFKLKSGDFLDTEAGRLLVPVVMVPVPENIVQVSDTAANDSDKTFTVPSGKQWRVLWGFASFVTSAQAGNRRMAFRIQDENNNVIFESKSLNVQVASVTELYNFLPGISDTSESVAALHMMPFPRNTILPENFSMRILDAAVVDAAVDDLTIRLIVEETEVTGE